MLTNNINIHKNHTDLPHCFEMKIVNRTLIKQYSKETNISSDFFSLEKC